MPEQQEIGGMNLPQDGVETIVRESPYSTYLDDGTRLFKRTKADHHNHWRMLRIGDEEFPYNAGYVFHHPPEEWIERPNGTQVQGSHMAEIYRHQMVQDYLREQERRENVWWRRLLRLNR